MFHTPERITLVALTDRDIQFIQRALAKDDMNNDENTVVYSQFCDLSDDLSIDYLETE